ncbi:hypothetical protein [Paenarthrobacter sp.]|uniref:hypothetical protein n=1 Tax=Paenarthrobacter sp. TaxID=1931993 RepID=UPI002811D866|nr:hypothetical protein [Paenarthrobacter sp.]
MNSTQRNVPYRLLIRGYREADHTSGSTARASQGLVEIPTDSAAAPGLGLEIGRMSA